MHEFLTAFGNNTTIVRVLQNEGLLPRTMDCETCGNEMCEQGYRTTDGISFFCAKRTCRKRRSVRTGTFFQQSKLPLCKAMLFLHLWSQGYTENLILTDYQFARQTVVDWSRFCRELCIKHYEEIEEMIGGVDCIVEIDETLVVKRKYDRGRQLADGWLFGGIERRQDGQFKCFMKLVYNRSEALLIHLIREHVRPGTRIITDGWAAYRNLATYEYVHDVVIHAENFVAPHDATIHTQRIESTWCSLKRFIRQRGTHKGSFYLEYICEWLFRREFSDVFTALLTEIRRSYNFDH